MLKSRVPKILLKSVYETFRTDSKDGILQAIKSVPGLSVEDGLNLANLAKACKDFADFDAIVHADLNPGSIKLNDGQMALLAGGAGSFGNNSVLVAKQNFAASGGAHAASLRKIHEKLKKYNVNPGFTVPPKK